MSSKPAGVCGRELEALPRAWTVEARLAVDLAEVGVPLARSLELRCVLCRGSAASTRAVQLAYVSLSFG